MADIEDTEDKFRRNLLAFCALVIAGVYLQIPLPTVIEQLLGTPVSNALPERLLVVQSVVFAYLTHRYYFASSREGAVDQIAKQIRSIALSRRFAFVLGEIERSNSQGRPEGPMFSLTHEDLVSHLNKARERESMVLVDPNELITKLAPPTEVSTWRYDMTPVLHNKNSGDQFVRMEGLNVSFRFTTTRKLRFYAVGALKTMFVGAALTEHLVPLIAVIGTAGTLAYKCYVLAG